MRRTSFAVALVLAADARLLSQAPSQPLTPLVLDEYVRVPDSNPMSTAKVSLGRALFFDPVLSVIRSIACGSCHRPSRAFSDTTRVSFGILGRETTRNTPSILNRAYGDSFFWDGRAASLEEAVLQPITNAAEMGLPLPRLANRLRRDSTYRRQFATVFRDILTVANVARALASYVRFLRSGKSPLIGTSRGTTVR